MNVKFILEKGGEPVALMKDMRDTMRVAGTWMRDLRNTFQALKKAIPYVDKERMPDPKSAIKEVYCFFSLPRYDFLKLIFTERNYFSCLRNVF